MSHETNPPTDLRQAETGRLRPAIFLDRDGTVIREVGYLRRPEQVELLPGVGDAICCANRRNIPVILVTNQSAVARGWLTEEVLADIHHQLAVQLARYGARLDGIYYCPHHPEGSRPEYRLACRCRKPEPGLLLRAAADFRLALERSVMIGDKLDDVEAGRRAGTKTILVETGYGARLWAERAPDAPRPDLVAPDLGSAVGWFLETLDH
jgi:D-glycero-D-manno-heptose 1,7-bisphosphate phosphatase